MGQDGRFEKWAGVVLSLVSLILSAHLARTYVLPRLDSHPRISTRRSSPAVARTAVQNQSNTGSDSPISQARKLDSLKETSAVNARRSSIPSRDVRISQISKDTGKPEARGSTETASASPVPVEDKALVETATSRAASLPPTRKFETIGYVEKPDGTKQAVVSKGDQVFVVHEGEVFDEHYRVLSISSTEVEAADLTVPQLAPAAPPEPTVLARQSAPPAETLAAPQPIPTVAEAKPLGFVERPGRPAETIVPDGDSVRLVASTSVPDDSSAIVTASASLHGDISPAALNEVTSNNNKEVPAEAGLTKGSTAESSIPVSLDSNFGMGMTAGVVPSSELAGASLREVSLKSPPEDLSLARAGPVYPLRQTLKAFCYVERPSTGREAFVAIGDSVYSVREGNVIADRYRVLSIRPEGVQVEDATVQTRPPPWPDREVAQNRKLSDGISEPGNHSPPAELPLNVMARSVEFMLTDFALNNVTPSAELRQLTENLAEPTIKDPRPSIPNVRVGPNERTALLNPPLTIGQYHDEAPPEKRGGIRGSEVPDRMPGPVANHPVGDRSRQEIALLPLNVNCELLSLSGQARDGYPVGIVIGESERPSVAVAGQDSAAASNDAHPEGPTVVGIQTGPAPADSATGIAEVSSLSGRDLLLHFSIGNNGCYFP